MSNRPLSTTVRIPLICFVCATRLISLPISKTKGQQGPKPQDWRQVVRFHPNRPKDDEDTSNETPRMVSDGLGSGSREELKVHVAC